MAGKNVDEVLVGANGALWTAPKGTAAPVLPASAPGAGWVDLGYADENGATATKGRTVAGVAGWQSFFDLRKIVTGESFKVTCALQQWNDANFIFAFGGGAVTQQAGPPIHYKYEPPDPGTLEEKAFILDWKDGAKNYRLIIPRGIIVDEVQTNITKAGAAKLPVGFEVLGTDGIKPWYLLTDDAAFNPAA